MAAVKGGANSESMAETKSLTNYRITDHARDEMARCQITAAEVVRVLAAPEQIETVREGREVYQSRLQAGDPPTIYLLRVFVDSDRFPPDVVTVYRSSKVAKYWRTAT
ncbi:MAG: DUF4258 domain-containing protein [candidate division KSB1 bacterium]|nr:DUF4258 domain-containing protein [candidate division KSB1 bacterium]MDZ7274755.1 DUF4258 domain-containing protein [candidate division KSB1 bacterium]MDZ7285580.1 DUF4258 domain-containing protein [candidate division KSB1 bacterium]MDZ7298612.1 DUF4258 domain-containing protein [candidate division KSB1 bacterium]MDZ7349476.1 DUF4258 domain-containing protein [candidate division KSB1 bacterium]